MQQIKKVWNNLEAYLCAATLVVMLVALTMQVIARFVFSTGIRWSEELGRYCLIWMIFISASLAAQTDSHIRVDMVINLWPKPLRKWVERLGNLVWLVFIVLLAVKGFAYTAGVFQQSQNGIALDIKLGWIYLAIPLGYALMGIRIVEKFVKSFRQPTHTETEEK